MAIPNNRANQKPIENHWELEVYQLGFDAAMRIFNLSKLFPPQERYSLTDQIRKSSRSVCSNIAEGWGRRRYEAAFVNKFNEAFSEARETLSWIQFAVKCEYLSRSEGADLHQTYDRIIGKRVTMETNPHPWLLPIKRQKNNG